MGKILLKKMLFSLLLSAAVTTCAFGFTACDKPEDRIPDDGNNGDGDTLTLDFIEIKEDGEVVAYSVGGIGEAVQTTIVIPSDYKGKPVTGIEERAFENCSFTSVTIPDTVASIGGYAFYECSSLKNITIGAGLDFVGEFAFGRCSALEEVHISDIESWCETQFENLSANPLYFAGSLYLGEEPITNLTVPDGVTKVGDYAFYGVENLESVIIGNGASSIGEYAFSGCKNLKTASAGSSVTDVGAFAFYGCEQLCSVAFGGGLKNIGDYAFYSCGSLSELQLSAVVSIGECAFTMCSALESLALGEELLSIGDFAFAGCTSLKNFNMPDSVTSIGLGILMFETGGFEGEVLFNALTEIVMSDNITEIPDYAFSHCNITSVKIGESVNSIAYSSFYGCALLESLVIPESVTEISSYAFYHCSVKYRHECNCEDGCFCGDECENFCLVPYYECDVFYEGTASSWARIKIGKNGNEILNNKETLYFYSETQPVTEGNFWHYVDGEIIKW